MKTFKQLREDIGVVKNIMNPADIRNVRIFSEKMSSSFQASVPHALKRLEDELNKYGYSLGSMELEGEFTEDGEAFLVVETFSTHEIVQNVYFLMSWRLLSNGQQYQYRHDGSALNFQVTLTLFEAAPELLKKLIDSQEQGYITYNLD